MTNKNNLKIVNVDITSLKSAVYNPRKWEQSAIDQLTDSIKRFGLVDPIIVNGSPKRKNIVIGGHFRLKIAKDLGYKKVPVVFLNIPNIEKEKELNLRLNRNVGSWDIQLLKDLDIKMLLDVGFNDSELSEIWDEVLGVEDDFFDVEKELEKIKEPKSKLGDIYELGSHRLICGNCLDSEVLKKLFGKEKAEMIYSDPPYNINLNYNKGIGGKKNYGGNVQDNKSDEEYGEFLKKSLINALDFTKDDCHIFYYCDERYIGMIQFLYQELGIDNKRVCLWLKNGFSPTPHTAFNKCYEPCVYGIKGKPYLSDIKNLNEVLNKEVETGNRLVDDILDLLNIWLVKRLPSSEYEHPTQKPPTLHEKALRRCSNPGDIILDGFGGSGSTLIASDQLKRRAFLVEKEPIFVDLIIKRYEQHTNKKAKKIG